MAKLKIDHTWDGHPVSTGERAWVELGRDAASWVMRWSAPFVGDPAPPGPPGPTPDLWNYEVIELFVAGRGSAYLEIEVGPYGHHLMLQLVDIRVPARDSLPLHIIDLRRTARRWSGAARIPEAWMPAGPLRANAFRIAGVGDARRHFAAHPLPGTEPDFHQPMHFPAFEPKDIQGDPAGIAAPG